MIALTAYACVLINNVGTYAGGSDSSGYMNMAKMLREGRAQATMRTLPDLPREKLPGYNDYVYVPLGFRPLQHHTMVATYPLGVPLMIAGVSFLTGWNDAAAWVIIAHSLAGLFVVFVLGRTFGLSQGWSLLSILLLALCPIYATFSVQLMSDVPAMVWVAASVLLALRARTRAPDALWAGAAFSIAVLIRPTNVLVLPALAIIFGRDWKRWGLWMLGGLPGAALLLGYDQSAYGNPLETGYGNMWTLMSIGIAPTTLLHYVTWLPVLLSPLVLLSGALPWTKSAPRDLRWVLVLWMLPFLAFYLFYFHTHEFWWYLRFLLPAFPAMTIGGVLVAKQIDQRFHWGMFAAQGPRFRHVGTALLLVLVSANGLYWLHHLRAWRSGKREAHYVASCSWARDNLPANTVIATCQMSGAFTFYTDFTVVRWDMFSPEILQLMDNSARTNGRPVVAAVFDYEQTTALQEKMPGRWTLLRRDGNTSLWLRAASATPPPS